MTRAKFDLYTRTNQLIVDGLIFAISFAVAYLIRFEGLPPWRYVQQFLLWLPYLIALRLYVNWRAGIYRFIWRYVSLADAIVITKSLSIGTGMLLALRLFYPSRAALSSRLKISLAIIVLEFLISLLGCLAARALRRVLYQRQAGRAAEAEKVRRLLLIGAGRVGVMAAHEIASNPYVELVGFLDDDPKKIGSVISGVRVLGPLDSLPSVVARNEVEEVVICIPRAPRPVLKRLWALCEDLAVHTKIVPTLEEVLQGKVNIAAFRDIQMADLLGREMVEAAGDVSDLAPIYTGKRILITGAGGSIGSELARQLFELKPAELVLLDKDENGLNEIYVRLGSKPDDVAVHPVVADIRFPERLRGIFSRFCPEVVFHAAAHKHVPLMEMNPCEAILNNVVGTRNLVELAGDSGVSHFVFISTDKAVKPVSIMGASKRVCEMIVQAHANNGPTRFSCVRFGNVMGSRGSVIPLFQQQIARGGPVTVTHPDVQRFLMTIPEAVRLVIRAGTLGRGGEIFILDMGDPVPIVDLARDLIELSGLRPGRDIQIEMTQLRPGEKLTEELIDVATERLSPTRFDKIRVVTGQPIDPSSVAGKLTALEEAARRESSQEIFQILRAFNMGFEPDGERQGNGGLEKALEPISPAKSS
jgi:FlaA1/EpsC-like NDP-sugar epimerase